MIKKKKEKMFGHIICLKFKNIHYIYIYIYIYKDLKQNDKTRIIKVKSIENEEIIMATTMAKIIITVIMKIIIVIIIIININNNNNNNENQNW